MLSGELAHLNWQTHQIQIYGLSILGFEFTVGFGESKV